MSAVMEQSKHGSYAGYSAGCRCDQCRAAKALYERTKRAEKAGRPVSPGRTPAAAPPKDPAALAWDAGYARGRRDAMALALSAAEVQAPAFARQLRALADRMEATR